MFDWVAGLVAGLARGANKGMTVAIALICVTAIAWAPVKADDAGRWVEPVLWIVGTMASILTLAYLFAPGQPSDSRSLQQKKAGAAGHGRNGLQGRQDRDDEGADGNEAGGP